MRVVFLSLLAILSISLTSCSKTKEQTRMEKLEAAQSAINEQRFNDAIDILDDMPKDYAVVDLISTAYAGRAGFSALSVYDSLEKNKENPQQALYEVAKKYDKLNILDSQKALEYIHTLNQNPDKRPIEMNLKYSTIQIYKISQILQKNIKHFEDGENVEAIAWNPCLEANFLSLDLREIIISINRAVLSIKNIQQNIYSEVRKIQEQYNIDPTLFEDEVVKATDITRLRVKVGEDYSDYVGENKTYTCDPNDTNYGLF